MPTINCREVYGNFSDPHETPHEVSSKLTSSVANVEKGPILVPPSTLHESTFTFSTMLSSPIVSGEGTPRRTVQAKGKVTNGKLNPVGGPKVVVM
ncbi:hypothetical protein TIFTF001_009661 [Ficus carica]|uniref:Uncharacterized protein n=1 Tax=Ficus carica TaxID=3494 RepID=A0AA88AHH9_FICCA|nr:hypothetical protein TIFTF001_009661 [Ficus carica]